MRIEKIEELVQDKRLARHRGQVFFTTYEPEEAEFFKKEGATVHPYSSAGITFWEIHLASLLDPVFAESPLVGEEPRDVRQEVVYEHFRKRDGYELDLLIPLEERN